MKLRKIVILAVCLIGLLIVLKMTKQENTLPLQHSQEKPLKIAIATDLHYLSPKLTDKGEFFTDLINNADGKNMFFIEEITDAFIDEMTKVKPELLIISGDLTFNGERESHLNLEKKLRKLSDKGIQVLIIPGNHDINRPTSARFTEESYELVESVSKNRFRDIYHNYGLQQALHKDDNSLTYIYQARQDLWLLMIDSNSRDINNISAQTLRWIEDRLQEARKNNIEVISVTHQTLLNHHPSLSSGFQIDKANQLEQLYIDNDVKMNLSGHIHIQHILTGKLTEVVTSSLAVSPHQYGMINYNGQKLDYQSKSLEISEWAKRNQRNEFDLLNFTELSRNFMVDLSERKFSEYLPKNDLSETEKEEAVRTLAELNADYFAGQVKDTAKHEQGIRILQNNYGDFMTSYLEVILSEKDRENQKIQIDFSQ